MKMLVTVVSSLLVGLSLASSNFSPIHELQNFIVNKRRIFISVAVAVTGFFCVLSGILISLVETALQYDAQGFVAWSSLFMVGTGLAIAGLVSFVLAKALIPARIVQPESIFAELSKQFNVPEILEGFMRKMAEDQPKAGPETPPAASAAEDFRDEKFKDQRRESTFADPEIAKNILHH